MKKHVIILLCGLMILSLFTNSCKKDEGLLVSDTEIDPNAIEPDTTVSVELFKPNATNVQTTEIDYTLPFSEEPVKLNVEIIDGYYIAEGDIIVSEPGVELRGVVTTKAGRRWPNGIMPYVIENGHPRRQTILDAIEYVNETTNLRVLARNGQTDYVKFVDGSGCSSSVGRRGGMQTINIGNCPFGSTVHEILHAAGMWHEHSRCDRDDYVTIHWDNIIEGKSGNFVAHCIDAKDISSYDYGSIMHYSSTGFSKNGLNTISINMPPGTPSTTIGQRIEMSPTDIHTINSIYEHPNPAFRGKFTGVFQKNDKDHKIWIGANWSHFNEKREEFHNRGYRLIDVETYKNNGKLYYDGVWEESSTEEKFFQYTSWGDFKDKWKELGEDGYRLVDIETFKLGADRFYCGVFHEGRGKYSLFLYHNWDRFNDKWEELGEKGFRLIDIESFVRGSSQSYIGVWRGGNDDYGLLQTTSLEEYNKVKKDLRNKGVKQIDFERLRVNGVNKYIGVFRETGDAQKFWNNAIWSSFNNKRKKWRDQGYQLIDLEHHP